jgi:hypothetical protein
MRFLESCVSNVLPGGGTSVYNAIPVTYFNNVFSKDNMLPAGLPLVSSTSPDIRNAMRRIFEAMGSDTNLGPFFLADRQMNQEKGGLIGLSPPLAVSKVRDLIYEAASGNRESGTKVMSYLQKVCSRFSSLNSRFF